MFDPKQANRAARKRQQYQRLGQQPLFATGQPMGFAETIHYHFPFREGTCAPPTQADKSAF